LPPADGANHALDIEFIFGASAIQQRSVGRHKQRRSDSSDARFMLTKESEHGRTARALYSVIRPEMEGIGYLELCD
jgi:hypothetical protein